MLRVMIVRKGDNRGPAAPNGAPVWGTAVQPNRKIYRSLPSDVAGWGHNIIAKGMRIMLETSLLITALLFGGTVLYAFGFAAFVFTALPAESAGPLIRQAFPHFYMFVLLSASLAGVLCVTIDSFSAITLGAIVATTVLAREVIMPAVNAAMDAGATARFRGLHSLSVLITLAHIVGAAVVIVRLAVIV